MRFDGVEEFLKAPGVEHIFQARTRAVCAVAMFDEDAHDGIRHGNGVMGRNDNARIPREILVPGDAAQREAIPDARCHCGAFKNLYGLKADVVGVFQRGNDTATIKGHVELARQAIKRAIIEDMVMPCPRVGAGVDQLDRINACGCRSCDIADVVRARSARGDADVRQGLDDSRCMFRADFADLQVCARGDMGKAASEPVGDVANSRELPMLQDPVGNPHAAHVAVLRGPDIEQPMIAPAEIVVRLGECSRFSLRFEALIGVEGMLGALPFLLVGQLPTGCRDTVLCFQMDFVGACVAGGRGRCGRTHTADGLHARHEAFEIALLLCREVTGHGQAAFCSARARPKIRSERMDSMSVWPRISSRYQRPSAVSP